MRDLPSFPLRRSLMIRSLARSLGPSSLVVLTCFVSASPGQAQMRRPGFTITPRAGVFLPGRALGDAPISTQTAGSPPSAVLAELEAGALFGAAVTWQSAASIVSGRVAFDYAPTLPVRLDGQESTFDASMALATAGLTLMPRGGPLRPFALAALGIRTYRFSPTASAGPQLSASTALAGRAGAGLELDAGPVTFTAEIHGIVSTYRFDEVQGAGGQRRLQADALPLIGVRIGPF